MLRRVRGSKATNIISPMSPDSPSALEPALTPQTPPPTTISRATSKDEGSVVSELTGISDVYSFPTNEGQHHSPVHAKSLLTSATLDASHLQSLEGLEASMSFDSGFDTALPVLPEETPSVLQSVASSNGGMATAAQDLIPPNDNCERDSMNRCEEATSRIDFLQDPKSSMTFGRRIGLSLMKYKWYFKPKEVEEIDFDQMGMSTEMSTDKLSLNVTEAYPFTCSQRESPSLEKAWAYFEHVTLPRYLVQPKEGSRKNIFVRCFRKMFCKGSKELTRAEPGERILPSKLYEPVFTPHTQLGDFGLGIGLYFSILRAMFIITLILGLVNIPNIRYFSSVEYSNGQLGVRTLLQGSAICTETKWVPCPDCGTNESALLPNFDLPTTRIGFVNASDNESLWFALQNNCDGATLYQGMINYATLWLLCIGVIGLNIYLRIMEVKMDEDEQTGQDYSIVVENPPGDATDPNEWKAYFDTTFGTHVTACTVAVNNDLLVQSLVQRRETLRQIEMMVDPGTSLDRLTLAGIAAEEELRRKMIHSLIARVVPGLPEFFAKLIVLTAKVQGLAQQDYPATTVFVTFETESDQRKVLTALQCNSRMDRIRNKLSTAKDPAHLFRGTKLLSVSEPEEPSTIRWQDLNETIKERVKQQSFTLLATVAAICLIALIVAVLDATDAKIILSSFAIAIFNALFPIFAQWLNSFESHSSAGGVQRSLYCKIALFRWVNTAVVITIITPFTSALTDAGGLISQIFTLFFADIVTTNAIQFLDPMGHINRHILAPRAHTQDAMNLGFQGSSFELAERYTNMTKIVFLALWYCAIYPGALFMCSFALLINYFVDRFSLMRTWKRQPHLGAKISEVSRRYFFSVSIVVMAIMSSYYWSAFPFDNLCVTDNPVNASYVGNWSITTLATTSEGVTSNVNDISQVDDGDFAFSYCLQDFFRFPLGERHFPFIPEFQPDGYEWMTPEQESLTRVYGWSALAIMLLVAVMFLGVIVVGVLGIFFSDKYESTGEDQGINFSDVLSISSYVPQVQSRVYSYPLLACNVDQIDHDLLEWTDPDRPYSFYDLTRDAEVLTRGMDVSKKIVFSQICHWAPPKKD